MSLKEIIEQRILDSNAKVNNCYSGKTLLTSSALLSLLVFDTLVFFYTLIVNLNLPIIMILSLILIMQLVLFLITLPRLNLSNRSMNFILYVIVYGLPTIIYLILAINNFQVFEIFVLIVRILIFSILVTNINNKIINRTFLVLSIILAISINIFLVTNETMTGKQNFSRRISYRYSKDKDGYQVSAISNGLSSKVAISNTYMGKKVVSINKNAFKNINEGGRIKEISIPANVQSVDNDAFTTCKNPIKIVTQSEDIKFGSSLNKCETVESVTFVNGVKDDYDFSFLSSNSSDFQVVLPKEQLSQFKDNQYLKNRLVPYTESDQIYVNFYDGEILLSSIIVTKNNNKYFINKPDNLELVGDSTDFFLGWYFEQDLNNDSKIEDKDFPLELTQSTKLYGKFLSSYHISYNIKDEGSLAGENYNREMGILELPEPEKTGYDFDGWYNSNTYTGDKIEEIDTSKGEDIALFGQFIPTIYTIEYENEKGITNNNPKTYTIEDEVVINDLSKAGYNFDGWFDSATGGNKVEVLLNSHGNKTLYAHWTPIAYNLTYDFNYDDIADEVTTYNTENSSLLEPTRDGYEFAGWYDNAAGTGVKISNLGGKINDKKLYAQWTLIDYTVTYNFGLAGATIKDGETLKEVYTVEDADIDLTGLKLEKAGYDFIGWYDSPTDGNEVTSIDTAITHNQTVYARWDAIEYTVQFLNLEGGNPNNDNTYTTADGPLNDATREGYKFLGWHFESDFSDEPVDSLNGYTEIQILYANWKPEKYEIVYLDIPEELITPEYESKSSYTIEDTITLPVPERAGYVFDGWHEVGSEAPTTSISVGTTGDKVFYAKWTIIPYHIIYEDWDYNDNRNYVNNLDDSYNVNTATINLPQNLTRDYYTFEGWYQKVEGGEDILVTSIPKGSTGDKELYVKWKGIPYNISFEQLDNTGAAKLKTHQLASLFAAIQEEFKTYAADDIIEFGGNGTLATFINNWLNEQESDEKIQGDTHSLSQMKVHIIAAHMGIIPVTSTESYHNALQITLLEVSITTK